MSSNRMAEAFVFWLVIIIIGLIVALLGVWKAIELLGGWLW